MKKTMVVLAAATLMTTLAFAAPEGGEHGHHGRHGDETHARGMDHDGAGRHHARMMEHLAEELNLSEAQKVQMRQIHEGFRAQSEPQRTAMHETMKQLHDARKASDTARAQQLAATLEGQRLQMREQFRSQHERMMALLTSEQRSQLEAMKTEREERRGERRGRRGGEGRRGGAANF